MKYSLSLLLSLLSLAGWAQQSPQEQITQTLQAQTQAWNRGDLNSFMQGYWQSDSLLFIGKSGLTYGWQQTLDNYQKNYPDARAMGQLSFLEINVKPLPGGEAYFVVGRWHLKRDKSAGDLGGYFSLLWEEKDGQWVVVADHSS
jgi:ketosteroid isomerase-like protein